jgi:hypothetical protein
MHLVITAAVATLSGRGVDDESSVDGLGRDVVSHIALFQLERAMNGVQDVAQSEGNSGFRRIEL